MTNTRKTPYVSVNLRTDARDELRRATLELTSPAGRRISMSDVLVAALEVGLEHRDEIVGRLREDT